MKKHLTIAILLLFCINIFSQSNELSFGRYSFQESKGYKIKIREYEDKISIEVNLADSISQKLYTDESYVKLDKKLVKIGSKNKKLDIELLKSSALMYDELYEKYTFYKSDILILDKVNFSEYYSEFNQVLNSPTCILEPKKYTRVVLDGYTITLITKRKNHQDILNLASPNEESHPILIKFLKDTFELFRNEKKNDFIDREYTFGL